MESRPYLPPDTRSPRRSRPPGAVRRAEARRVARDLEQVDEDAGSWWAVLSWTLCFFVIPMLLYLGWAFTRSDEVTPGCVDAAGAPCLAPRIQALVSFVDALPALIGAVAIAIVASVFLRRLTVAWRASTVAFATAVIGAGLATLVASILR